MVFIASPSALSPRAYPFYWHVGGELRIKGGEDVGKMQRMTTEQRSNPGCKAHAKQDGKGETGSWICSFEATWRYGEDGMLVPGINEAGCALRSDVFPGGAASTFYAFGGYGTFWDRHRPVFKDGLPCSRILNSDYYESLFRGSCNQASTEWSVVIPQGDRPGPKAGCSMASLPDGCVLFGGYECPFDAQGEYNKHPKHFGDIYVCRETHFVASQQCRHRWCRRSFA